MLGHALVEDEHWPQATRLRVLGQTRAHAPMGWPSMLTPPPSALISTDIARARKRTTARVEMQLLSRIGTSTALTLAMTDFPIVPPHYLSF